MSTIPEDEPITVAKLLWLVVHFDLVTVDVAQGAAIRSLHGHILIVVGNYAGNTYMRDATPCRERSQSKSSWGRFEKKLVFFAFSYRENYKQTKGYLNGILQKNRAGS